jgi:hypothetical protein
MLEILAKCIAIWMFTFAGVATNRLGKRQRVWTLGAIAYSLGAAILTVLLLRWLGLAP